MRIFGLPINLGVVSVVAALLVFGAQAKDSETPAPQPSASKSSDGTSTQVTGLPQVTVQALSEAERRRLDHAIPAFIQSHAAPARFGQYARWITPICVTIAGGLPASFEEFVRRRIAEVANSVGARVNQDPECSPNVNIFFAAQPQKQLDEVVRVAPGLLGYYYKSQTKDMMAFSGPVRAWYTIGAKGTSGRLERVSPNARAPDGVAGSKLSSGASIALTTVLVIADGKTLAGYEIGPVSDYIAMLILSKTPAPDKCADLNSILDLLATQCDRSHAPQGMTQTDIAFLKALYTTNLELVGALEKGNIHDMMLRSLGGH